MMATGDGMRVSGRIIVVIGLALATAPWAAPCARAGTPPAAPAADLFHAGDYVAAAARFTAALEAPGAPRGAEAGRLHFDLGVCRLRLGQLAEAEYRMRQALLLIDDDLGPGSREGAAAREGLATVLISQGNMLPAAAGAPGGGRGSCARPGGGPPAHVGDGRRRAPADGGGGRRLGCARLPPPFPRCAPGRACGIMPPGRHGRRRRGGARARRTA